MSDLSDLQMGELNHKVRVQSPMRNWDDLYNSNGFRRWPNEALVSWFSQHYGHMEKEYREKFAILEVGCGAGNNLRLFLESGFPNVTGIDTSQAALDQAFHLLHHLGYTADLRPMTICRPHLHPESFDLVVDVTCLQHVLGHDFTDALLNIRRVLKPGGMLFTYQLGFGTDYADVFPGNPPINAFTQTMLRRNLKEAGFGKVEINPWMRWYHGGEYQATYWCATAERE